MFLQLVVESRPLTIIGPKGLNRPGVVWRWGLIQNQGVACVGLPDVCHSGLFCKRSNTSERAIFQRDLGCRPGFLAVLK